jgi:TonB family protein
MSSIERARDSPLLHLRHCAAEQPTANAGRARAPSNPRGVALALSLCAHAALGSFALHPLRANGRAQASLETESRLELVAPDLLPLSTVPDALGDTRENEARLHRIQAPEAHRAVPLASLRSAPGAPGPHEPSSAPELGAPEAATAATGDAAIGRVGAPSFLLTARAVTGAAKGPRSEALALALAVSAGSQPIAEQAADTPARLVHGTPPVYTEAALAAGVEAEVPLEIVVDDFGSVRSAASLARVGYGLDEAALIAVRSYRFRPALRANKTVAVRMRWLMRFELR